MKKTLLLATLLTASYFTTNAQTVLFEDNFESYPNFEYQNVSPWTLFDGDGAVANYSFQGAIFPNQGELPSFIVLNPSQITPAITTAAAHSGSKYMAAFASGNLTQAGQYVAVTQSDWLISPQITLGSSGNTVKFWAKSYSHQYGKERFKVHISTTNTNTTSFTQISTGNFIEAPVEWTEYTYTLPSSYNGQNVHIAIECVSHDVFAFFVDDFSVTTTGTASIENQSVNSITIFPNPANNVLNISNGKNSEISSVTITDLNGRIVLESEINSVNAEINVSELNSGVYIIKGKTSDETFIKKFVKK